jgi:hypothetical protein
MTPLFVPRGTPFLLVNQTRDSISQHSVPLLPFGIFFSECVEVHRDRMSYTCSSPDHVCRPLLDRKKNIPSFQQFHDPIDPMQTTHNLTRLFFFVCRTFESYGVWQAPMRRVNEFYGDFRMFGK